MANSNRERVTVEPLLMDTPCIKNTLEKNLHIKDRFNMVPIEELHILTIHFEPP